MSDPFIQRLQAKMQASSDPLANAECLATMACYWARSGDFARADSSCQQLRSLYGDGNYPRISMLIMCIEGLLLFFRDVSMASLDRLTRANLLCRAMGVNDVAAFSAAWMAHIYFNSDQFEEMCVSISQCLENLDSANSEARGRVAIVLSDSFLLAGNTVAERRWFKIARDAAEQLGDHTLVAALTYNRAALNAYMAQLQVLSGNAPQNSLDICHTELQSAIGYQRLAQLQSLEQLLHLVLVGIHVFRRDFEAGWALAKDLQSRYEKVLIPRQNALLSAQLRLCAQNTNRSVVEADASSLDAEIDSTLECDDGDRALILNCYSQIARSLGLTDRQERYDAEMRACLRLFHGKQEALGMLLHKFETVEI
jgi:hypothetical protein